MTVPDERRDGEPDVIARLAEEETRRFVRRQPSRTARIVGWIVIAAIVALIVEAAIEVHPW